MMRGAIRRFHSPDVDLETFRPTRADDCGILVQVLVGPADGPGEESFDVVVCTPRWLERQVREDGPLLGRHHLVMDKYDVARMRSFLTEEIESLEASTWSELASKIGRIGKWEFEDYEE
jgi:hypothetical protein